MAEPERRDRSWPVGRRIPRRGGNPCGGANDAANLWPEYPPTPNPKDKVENALHAAVCDGKVTLKAAQNAIASNWETAERNLGLS